MNRKDFITRCSMACVGGSVLPSLLYGCASAKIVSALMEGSELVFPEKEFEYLKKDRVLLRSYLVVQNDKLEYPICVYRNDATGYTALWMKCTHQGTELQAFGDKLHCPAHGSEFNKRGGVENGPASEPLRTFAASSIDGQIRILLR